MSSYLQSISTKSWFKEDDKDNILKTVKAAAAAYAPEYRISWRDDVLNADTLADVARIFNITLYHTESLGDGCQVLPIFDDTYHSNFFSELLPAVAPFMSDGSLELLNSDYGLYVIEFKAGVAAVSHS